MTTLQLIENDIQFTELSGKDCLKQRLQNRIALYLGEWSLEPTEGVDWFSVLGRRNVPTARYEELVRSAIIQDGEVIQIVGLNVDVLNSTEKVNEYFQRTGKSERLGKVIIEIEVDTIYGIVQLNN